MKRLLTILLILVAFAGKAQDPSPLPNVNVKKLIAPNNPIFYFNPVTYDFWVFMGEYGWRQLKNNEVTSITFSGDATKMLTLQQLYGGTKTATFTDNDNQTLSTTASGTTRTVTISGGNSVGFDVADNDNSTTNELNSSISWTDATNTLGVTDAGGTKSVEIIGFESTLNKGNLTAGSNKVTIGGTGTGSVIGSGASVDVNEGNLTLSNIGGAVTDVQVPNTITLDNITQITNRSHSNLSDIGSNTHAQIDSHITNDGDLSATNEIQDLSGSGATLSGYQISLSSDATPITLPSEADGNTTNEIQAPTLVGDNIGLTQTTTTISISGKEDKSNKITSISNSSTDTQYPSAKLLYDQLLLKEPANANIQQHIANDKDLVVGNEYNTGVSFNPTTKELGVTDGGGTKTTTISITSGSIVNAYINTFTVTTTENSVTWPQAFDNQNYKLDVDAYYYETQDGKSVRIKNAVYDYVKTVNGFSLKVDTIAGYIEYMAVDTTNLYPIQFNNYVPTSSITTVVGSPGSDTNIPSEKAVRTAINGFSSMVYPSAGIAVSTGSTWSPSITDNHLNWDKYNQWDGGSTGLNASNGRTSLGGTTIGQNIFTSTNPSSISFGRANADNTFTWLSASDFKTAIGAGVTNNPFVIKFDTGTTEGTDLYTFTGTATKTFDVKAGSNVSFTKSAGSITVNASGGGSFDGCVATTTNSTVQIKNYYTSININGTDIIDTNNYHGGNENFVARSAGYYEISLSAEISFSQATITNITIQLLTSPDAWQTTTLVRETTYQQDENFITGARLNVFFPPVIIYLPINNVLQFRIKANISDACSYGSFAEGLPIVIMKKIQ